MKNKERYESPFTEVISIVQEAVVCASERAAAVQTDTNYEFTDADW